MADSNREEAVLHGLEILMRRAYEKANAAGTLKRSSDGCEVFQLEMPVKGMPPWTCARFPNGQFRVNLNHMHRDLAPEMPWEHFEHQAHEIARAEDIKQRGGGRFRGFRNA